MRRDEYNRIVSEFRAPASAGRGLNQQERST